MRETLRRLLWLVPTLLLVTLLSFWSLSRTLEPQNLGLVDPGLPLLLNTNPEGVRELVWRAARASAAGGPQAADAARHLVQIGGAGLPHVLTRLDALSPAERETLALQLLPIAVRMGILAPDEARTGPQALEFWSRFAAERLVDFRPAIAKRAVARFAERSTELRVQEVRQLDTFALEEILKQLNEVVLALDSASDASAALLSVQRLTQMASDLAGLPWVLPADAGLAQAKELNVRWQGFWARNGSQYVNLVGVERLLAPVTQTQYSAWLAESIRLKFGVLSSGQSTLLALQQRAVPTLGLFFAGLFGGSLLGILVGQMSTAFRPQTAANLRGLALFLGLLTPALLLLRGAQTPAPTRFAAAVCVMLLVGALLVIRYQATSSGLQRQAGWVQAYRALGASSLRIAWRTLRAGSNLSISALAPHTSTLLTCVFVLEYAFNLQGIGPLTIAAIAEREFAWVMLITGATTALVALVQLASDALLNRLNPRTQRAAHSERWDA